MRIDAAQSNPARELLPPSSSQRSPASIHTPPAHDSLPPDTHDEQLQISFAEGHLLVYRFVDKETGDLVQQIPPEEVLRVMQGIQQWLQQSDEPEQLNLLF